MDYNARISQQFRSQSQNAGSRGRQKPDESDAFMRLSDREIAGCISDIGVQFSVEDLQKPNPQQIQKVFEWFAELLMNATRETIEPAMRAAAEDVCGDYIEIVPADTRNLMGFYVSLRKLLIECGITDFSFSDLLKPTHDRLGRIFSYIINFIRFREAQTATIDEHFNKAETTKARIDTLYIENQEMEARIDALKHERKSLEALSREKAKRNEEGKIRLLELKKGQENITERCSSLKSEKERLVISHQDTQEKCLLLRQESEKLRPYASQSTSSLQSHLSTLSNTLSTSKTTAENLEKRTRALQTSADTFAQTTQTISMCLNLLTEISKEIAKEEKENAEASKRRDRLSECNNNVRSVEHEEKRLKQQLYRWQDRTKKLRHDAEEKGEVARKKMEVLRGTHETLTEERGKKGKEMERKRMRIEETENRMQDLKEGVEREVRGAREEYLKMEAHVKLYITEIEQAI